MDDQPEFIKAGLEVQQSVYMEFKLLCVSNGLKFKYAITQALLLWIAEMKKGNHHDAKRTGSKDAHERRSQT